MSFKFQLGPDDDCLHLGSAVRQAIGAASTCWESLEDTGVFQQDQALEISEALIAFIYKLYPDDSWVNRDEVIGLGLAD